MRSNLGLTEIKFSLYLQIFLRKDSAEESWVGCKLGNKKRIVRGSWIQEQDKYCCIKYVLNYSFKYPSSGILYPSFIILCPLSFYSISFYPISFYPISFNPVTYYSVSYYAISYLPVSYILILISCILVLIFCYCFLFLVSCILILVSCILDLVLVSVYLICNHLRNIP